MHEKAEMKLSSLLEAFKEKSSQLRRAVFLGDDTLVVLLDREIEPLRAAALSYRAQTPADIRLQLRFVGELIREEAEDRGSVLRYVEALSMLLDRYHPLDMAATNAESVAPVDAGMRLSSEMLLDSLDEHIAVLACDHRVLYANRAYARSFNLMPDELVGRHIADIVGKDCYEANLRENLASCFLGEERRIRYTTGGNDLLAVSGRMTPLCVEGVVLGALLVVNGMVGA